VTRARQVSSCTTDRAFLPVGSEVAIVDAELAWALSDYHWQLRIDSTGRRYAAATVVCADARSRRLLMHRIILGLEPGDPRQTHHVNDDGLDNRLVNLRIVTPAQNQAARGPNRKGSSRYKGVCHNGTVARPWTAQIGVGGRHWYLGRFACERDAAAAYDGAARVLHGHYARLNLDGTQRAVESRAG